MDTKWFEDDGRPDTLGELIRAAGRREPPPEEVYRATLAAATAAWRVKTRRGQLRRSMAWAAAAAVAVVGAVALLDWRVPGGAQPDVARLERVAGSVELFDGDAWRRLQAGSAMLPGGVRLRTVAGSRAGLALEGGVSLRLGAATEAQIDSARRIYIARGTVYVDTGPAAARGLEVVTPAGTARDLGTQFELAVADGTLRLRVREGRVGIDRGGRLFTGSAGEQLSIDPFGGMTRASIAPDDDAWQWTQGLASPPDVDGRPATELLEWVARETGREVHYASPAIRAQAARAILHGDIRHLAPLEALEVMLATTDLEVVLADGATIEVRSKRGN